MDANAHNCKALLAKAEEKQKEIATKEKLTGKTSQLTKWIVARNKVRRERAAEHPDGC
jgi:hypothetical protein